SVMFAILHLPMIIWGNTPALLAAIWLFNLTLGGLMLGLAFVKAQTLWLSIGVHFSWNFVQYHVVGIGGSGINSFYNLGAELITGGVIGPEAGILGTVAFILLILIVWLLPKEWIASTPLMNKTSQKRDFPNET
ncbi:MAG: type II CAAX prenyl endopeptidase Rce1 family protein, partial [Promethearchaeota archaeon]